MQTLLDILRGALIGLANVIPGVSGGTMMVSMGIYDRVIWCINHLLKSFKQAMKTLLPILIGMAVAIVLGAFSLKYLFANFPLPTNTLFIGLILGGVPMIIKAMKGCRTGAPGILIFLLFFALVIWLKIIEGENVTSVTLNAGTIAILFILGALCSAAMVVPGVSGSMLLKTLGYYEPIITVAIPDLMHGLAHGDWSAVGHSVGILLPFGLGIVFGIFAIAKLIEWLLRSFKGWTFCGILGMVLASPVVILMDPANYQQVSWPLVLCSLVTFALGFIIALKLGADPEKP